MHPLEKHIKSSEDWLIRRILDYARRFEFTKYTSTLEEAWRISIVGLSETIIKALEKGDSPLELHPDENYSQDPVAAFGILEAQRHRERGIRLDMFLGLMKYYKQSYIDLVHESEFEKTAQTRYEYFIERCFDHIEIGFCAEWADTPDSKLFTDLQTTNRRMTNEKNKYLTLFESLHDPVFLLDIDDAVTNINHAAADLFVDFTVPGKSYYNPSDFRDRLPWLEEELRILKSKPDRSLEVEKTLDTRIGARCFQVKIQEMLDVSEKFSGTVVILDDITKEKTAQASLLQFKQIIEQIPVTVLMTNPAGEIEYINPKFTEVTGYNSEEAMGENPRILKSGEQPDATYKELWETITRGEVWTGEFHNKRKDGSLYWEAASIGPVLDESGITTHYVAVKEDITEQKRIQEKLRESETWFREIFNNVSDALFVHKIGKAGMPDQFVQVNDVACLRLGYTTEEFAQMSPGDLDDAQSGIDVPALMKELLKNGNKTFEQIHRHKNGSLIPVEISSHVFTLTGRKYVLSVARDITDRKETELKLKALLREKEILLKEVYHRVKNNFAIVSSLLSLQSSQLDDARASELFEESRDRVMTMSMIHQQLYQADDLSSVDFRSYLDKLALSLYRSYVKDPSRIRLKEDIDNIPVGVDLAIPCGLIVNELLTNAFKYAFPNNQDVSGNISLSLKQVNGEVELKVMDDGVGFPESFCIDKSESLGLQLVRMLTKQIRGSLEMVTPPGATFIIRFPYSPDSAGH